MANKLTLTIGIPAHNEEANINELLAKLLNQSANKYVLEKIIVICDGCTDNTAGVAAEFAKTHQNVVVINDGERKGKLIRLEEIYQLNFSDVILIFDGDVMPANNKVIDYMLEKFSDSKVGVVSGNSRALSGNSFYGKLLTSWSNVWYRAKIAYRKGNNVHNSKGCVIALQKDLAKKIQFPSNILSDSQYIYFRCLQEKMKFVFSIKSVVRYRKPDNINDYLLQINRGSDENKNLAEIFGEWVYKEYKIPRQYKINALVLNLFASPVYTVLGGINYLWTSKMRKNKSEQTKQAWETAVSTKQVINLESKNKVRTWWIWLVALLLLIVSVKGDGKVGNLKYQTDRETNLLSPFELSNSSARYALTEALGEQHTVFLTRELARFSAPDVVDYKGKFISIFTPGISFIGLPFYILGKSIGIEQLATYFAITLFALLNAYLIQLLAKRLGAGTWSAWLAGLLFVFATNALGYAQTFTQHHISTTCILLALLFATNKKSAKNYLYFGLVIGLSILMDIPNLIMLLPLIIYVGITSFQIYDDKSKIKLAFNPMVLLVIVGLMPSILGFAWYNYATTGSYTKLAQNIGRSHAFRKELAIQNPADSPPQKVSPSESDLKLLDTPFETRLLLNGFYILLTSNERSWLYYSPIVLLGFIGYWLAYKKHKSTQVVVLGLSIVFINIILYAMFGDPWGGWAFGPRYLIPSAALVCAGLGIFIQKINRNLLFNVLFWSLLIYSVFLSTLTAVTTQAIPPKVEAKGYPLHILYTHELNLQQVYLNQSSNLWYNVFLKPQNISLYFYWKAYATLVIFIMSFIYIKSASEKVESQI